MTFPSIQGTPVLTAQTSGSTFTANLPSRIQSGELVWIGMTVFGNTSITQPAGWTVPTNMSGLMSGNVGRMNCFWRIAGDSWPAGATTQDFTIGASVEGVAFAFRIAGTRSSTTVPTGGNANGNNASPDSGAQTPAPGSDNYLWLTMFGAVGNVLQPTPVYPINYTGIISGKSSTGASSVCTGAAYRQLTASVENPNGFTNGLTGAAQWRAYTGVIYPGPEGMVGYGSFNFGNFELGIG